MIGVIISIVSIISTHIYKRKLDYILESLDIMIDKAMNHKFVNTTYNETKVSALESKLSRFLYSSIYSVKNIEIERNRIKELISDISHQTKTPITNILLYIQLLQENPDIPKDANDILNHIYSQSDKLNFLIQALVNLSRLENNIINMSTKHESVKSLLKEVYSDNIETACKKGISLIINDNNDTNDIFATFDTKWTREALNNIVNNAIKYTPEQGVIHISIMKYEIFCRIDITDTGIGIKEEEQNSIFQRFYRSPSVFNYDGVGIGLYLSREIITTEGGYIKVHSIPGKGSTFSVFLPQ